MSQCLQLRTQLLKAEAQALKVDHDGTDSAVTGPTDHSGSDRSAVAASAALALRQVHLQASKMAESDANRGVDGALCAQLSELLAENALLRERLLLRSSATASRAPGSAASDRYTPEGSATTASWRLSNEELGAALGTTPMDGVASAFGILRERPQCHSQSEAGKGRWNSMYGIDANGQAPGLSYPGSPEALRLHARHTIT